jgi:uncharacterized protein (UPF0276 family)
MPARTGIGLRAQHHDALLEQPPNVSWLEAHSENYFADGGAQIEYLMKLRGMYPLSLHGVGLSIGSTDPLNREHLRKLQRLIERSEPALVSEHLSWGSAGGVYLNDLLPLPYTAEALQHMTNRVRQVQDYLGRRILIENVSSYLQFKDAELNEWDFLAELAHASDCGLIVDVNNIYVSARNHGFDAKTYIERIPRKYVSELHLAGHSINRHGDTEILIDTHSTHVCEDVWDLYAFALGAYGPIPTLIEWDTEIPALPVLIAEAEHADRYLENARDLAA